MKKYQLLISLMIISILGIFNSCATMGKKKTPTLSFTQYVLKDGPVAVHKEAGIEISLNAVQISNVYDYPKLFSFKIDNLPRTFARDPVVNTEYKSGKMDRSWEFPFASPDGSIQLLFCNCKVSNNTQHILRMKDARIYQIAEGLDPLPAVPSFSQLLDLADYFQDITNAQRSRETTFYILQKAPLPQGFFRTLVEYNRKSYRLINDLSVEILPGFSYEGILVFPVVPSYNPQAKIAFFDVTVKTDKAGNPIEKTQIDFFLESHNVFMWYDVTEKLWKEGFPPSI